jgi:hypothetical protein
MPLKTNWMMQSAPFDCFLPAQKTASQTVEAALCFLHFKNTLKTVNFCLPQHAQTLLPTPGPAPTTVIVCNQPGSSRLLQGHSLGVLEH